MDDAAEFACHAADLPVAELLADLKTLEDHAMQVIRNRIYEMDENPDVADMALCLMTQEELDEWMAETEENCP